MQRDLSMYLAAAVLAVGPAAATLIDFNINHDGSAQRVLRLQLPSQVAQPYALFPITSGPLTGSFGSIEPGWDGEGTDRPGEGAFALLSETGVSLRRERFDAGFAVYTEGLAPILEFDGAAHEFAGPPEDLGLLWHEHLTFVVDAGTPLGTIVTADFTLTDVNGLHADSAPFTLAFEVVPEPATALLLLIAGTAATRRR